MNLTAIRNGLILAGIVLALIVLCCSCGPAALLKRSQRLEARAILKGAVATEKTDTIVKDSLIYLPGTSADTMATSVNFADTVYLDSKDVITKVKVDVVKRTVYVHTLCKSKTIRVRQRFFITKSKTIKAGFTNWQHYSQVIGGILFGLVAGALLGRVLKLIR